MTSWFRNPSISARYERLLSRIWNAIISIHLHPHIQSHREEIDIDLAIAKQSLGIIMPKLLSFRTMLLLTRKNTLRKDLNRQLAIALQLPQKQEQDYSRFRKKRSNEPSLRERGSGQIKIKKLGLFSKRRNGSFVWLLFFPVMSVKNNSSIITEAWRIQTFRN